MEQVTNKQRAPRNRTLTLNDEDISRLKKHLIKLEKPVSFEEIENKTIHQDIFEALGETKQVKINFKEDDVDISELNEKQKTIYKILSSEPKNFDSILSETGLEVQDITMNLSVMELKGFIEKSSRGDYEVIEN